MAEHPLLVFPERSSVDRKKRSGGGGKIRRPGPQQQAERFTPQFEHLRQAMEQQRIDLQGNTSGLEPERVLVMETIGPIENFAKAVKKIEGMEWLGEFDLDEIEPDYGFSDEKDPDKFLKGRLFLTMTDMRALEELISLFDTWKKNPDARFRRGFAPLKKVFVHLHTIRHWNAEDRIRDTGILDDWNERITHGQETVLFEAEIWFRGDPDRRNQAGAYLSNLIDSLQGRVLGKCVIPEIAYHGLLGEIPVGQIPVLLDEDALHEISLLRCEDIMYLYPVGQCAVRVPTDQSEVEILNEKKTSSALPKGEPLVALFDGLPLAGHELLKGRLTIDDPDGYETPGYQAVARCHGTAMASLICHGDLNEAGKAITRPLYVRPIMKARTDLSGGYEELIPDNLLPVDLVHRAVKRLYDGEGNEPPSAPSVRVVNLSVGNRFRPFDRRMSAWARLLDWLSWECNVLFIVSAGNHTHDIKLSIPRGEFQNKPQEERERLLLKAIADDTRHRRLLSPAEAINSLTLAATHSNASSTSGNPTKLIDPFSEAKSSEPRNIPSPFNAHGPGYRRSIKPDIFLPGGKQLFSEKVGTTHTNAILEPGGFAGPLGQLVAAPGIEGRLDEAHHTRGTSNAAALASRWTHFLFDVIERLRSEYESHLPEEYDAVLLKTLLVHGADWGKEIKQLYEASLEDRKNGRTFRDYVGKFLGYGSADVAKAMVCIDQRATILGVGKLEDGQAHEFSLPLPPSLSAVTDARRLIVTLAWMSPVLSAHRNYRIADLWVDGNPAKELTPDRINTTQKAAQRGTVQHEVFEGSSASEFQDGDNITIRVNCRADAGDIPGPVRYGLAVTLEVAEGVDIPIYQEVRDRLRVPVPAAAGNES